MFQNINRIKRDHQSVGDLSNREILLRVKSMRSGLDSENELLKKKRKNSLIAIKPWKQLKSI